MDPLSLIGTGAQIAGGIIGYLTSSGKYDEAEAILNTAAAQYGEITPATLQAVAPQVLGPSAYAQIQADPAFVDAQRNALSRLGNVLDQGGYTLEDRATQNRALNASARNASAARSQITQNMAARGVGGSGAELALLQANAQDQAGRDSDQALNTAAAAQRRYLDTILQRGNMATSMRGQDYSEKSRAAEAQDEIARYNAGAQERAAQYNNEVIQRNYQNKLGYADRRYQVARDQAAMKTGKGDRLAGMWGGIGEGVGQAANAWGTYNARPGAGAKAQSMPGSDYDWDENPYESDYPKRY